MTYHIERDENLAFGIRGILRDQLTRAAEEANDRRFAAVHSVRKQIKKTRALLLLVKDAIGAKNFAHAKRELRVAAHCFSDMRDAAVQLIVLEKLRVAAGLEKAALRETRALLTRQRRQAARAQGKRSLDGRPILETLSTQIEEWPFSGLTSKGLCRSLKKTYRQGRACLACLREEATAENFHSWRKHTKNLWYQARILRELSPAAMKEICETADQLADSLGDLHDLAFLRQWLEKNGPLPEQETEVLCALISVRENELKEAALEMGGRFFAEKPGDFGRRLLVHLQPANDPPSA